LNRETLAGTTLLEFGLNDCIETFQGGALPGCAMAASFNEPALATAELVLRVCHDGNKMM